MQCTIALIDYNVKLFYLILIDDMFPPDLQQELVSLLAPDMAAFLTVFSPLVQHYQQEAASTKLVSPKFQSPLLSLSKLMDVKTSSGFRPVAVANLQVSSDHCTVGQSPKGMVYFLEFAIVRVAGC